MYIIHIRICILKTILKCNTHVLLSESLKLLRYSTCGSYPILLPSILLYDVSYYARNISTCTQVEQFCIHFFLSYVQTPYTHLAAYKYIL